MQIHNRGFCKKQSLCSFFHPQNICENFLKEGNCVLTDCSSRHPKNYKYWIRGYCFRGKHCAFNHRVSQNTLTNFQPNSTIVNFVGETFALTVLLKKHMTNGTTQLPKLVRAACVRCHGTKCPLLTAFFFFSPGALLISQKELS